MLGQIVREYRTTHRLSTRRFAELCDLTCGYISMLENGKNPKTGKPIAPNLETLAKLASGMGLMLDELLLIMDEKETISLSHSEGRINPFPAPTVTDDVVTFPVLGDIAAGYEHVALENWEGDTIEVPRSLLRGRVESDYMVLRVCGDSMYPFYMEGDRVLILRTPTLERSGQVGCVRYDGENATLKKVEFVEGEDWLKLIPLNPMHPPRTIEGADLEQCSILGIPKLLVRILDE